MPTLQHNDQVHRARGPMGLTFEQPKSVDEGKDVEKPKDERAPVQRLVRHRLFAAGGRAAGLPGTGLIATGLTSAIAAGTPTGILWRLWNCLH